jgi:uncharacterized membrane protein (DUF106 family)
MVEITIVPYSTFFIMGLSFFLSLVTSLTNRLLTNREQMRAWNQEITSWRQDSLKASRSGDKKLMAKVKKQQKHIMELQSKMTWQSMKTSFIWFIPLLLLWWFFLTPTYTRPGVAPVAYLPWLGSQPMALTYFYWYLLCSFLSGAFLSRLLGLGLGGD